MWRMNHGVRPRLDLHRTAAVNGLGGGINTFDILPDNGTLKYGFDGRPSARTRRLSAGGVRGDYLQAGVLGRTRRFILS